MCLILIASTAAEDDAVDFIIGGNDAELGQFPHMASLRYVLAEGQEAVHVCGGGVISSRWVLTVCESYEEKIT